MELILLVCGSAGALWASLVVLVRMLRLRRTIEHVERSLPAAPARSPEWLAAMRELDELETDPEMRYFDGQASLSDKVTDSPNIPPIHRKMMSMTDAERIRFVRQLAVDHDVNVVRNACGDILYAFRTGEPGFYPGDGPAALITVPEYLTPEQIRDLEVEFRSRTARGGEIIPLPDGARYEHRPRTRNTGPL